MMAGTLALVGSGEFLERMRGVDAQLLARVGGAALARVVIIPTASVPDGPQVVARWIDRGRAHFTGLGAAVDAAPIATRADADDPAIVARIAAANVVYFSGGRPGFLRATLKETRAWAAVRAVYDQGGVLAGCSAGAMILGAKLIAPRLRLGWPWRFDDAFGLVPNTLILPHYDAGPAPLFALVRRSLPPTLTLLGIDEDTALISDDHGWQVAGQRGVEVARAGQRQRYRSGAHLVLNESR
jgi:cyanophycinase